MLTTIGIVTIFAATATPITDAPNNIVEVLSTQSLTYPRLQLIWFGVGLLAMFVLMFFHYKLYGRYNVGLYMLNILMLLVVLVLQTGGRGGMNAFIKWGSGSERGIQPSELGKVIIIICLAKNFATRKTPVATLKDFLWQTAYVGIPLVLIVLQPDFGTALVYVFIFAVMLFASNMDWKLIVILIGSLILLLI
ncbi:MAG: FtsW/RodA/SpoVE family cell cycle protein, partial [Selenomonadaceae bacterium]|nr:FtsW/RodA/SpoVE family cell cycle protein [Selenomonadaceae bacterium]